MIDQLLLAQNQDAAGEANADDGDVPDAPAGEGADDDAPDGSAGGGADGDAPDGAAGGGNGKDEGGDRGADVGAAIEPSNEDQNADPKQLQQEQIPDEVASIQNEGGGQENAENAIHMEEVLEDDEPTDSMEFSNLESLNSQCVNTTRGGREYDCNTSEYTQEVADDVDMMQTHELAEKYNQELAQKQAADQPKLHKNVQQISSPARHVETNIQNSPASPSCSTMTSPTHYLNLSNTQGGGTPTKPIKASFLEGDIKANEEMDRTCANIYTESYLDDGMEMGDNISVHGEGSGTQNKTREHQPYTQGPIFDQTPVQKESSIDITEAGKQQTTYTQGPIFDQTPVHKETEIGISNQENDDDAAQSNQPSQDVMIPNVVGGQRPACFDFDIVKCRELRSIIMSPNCTFDDEIIIRTGETFVKQMNIICSFADGTCAEQVFMDFFTESLKNDEKFRDGRSYVLNTTCSNLLNWECQYPLDDPQAQNFNKARVLKKLKKRLPEDMRNCKILYVPIVDRSHWYLMVVNGPAEVVEILDCFPYDQVGTDPYNKYNRPLKMEGKEYKWAPRFIARMSAILHEVRPKIGLPKFGRWDFHIVENLPKMVADSNDCAFYTMMFVKYYDPHTRAMTRSINQEMPGDLRSLVLTYLVYNGSNEVDSLPPEVEALRQ